MAIDVACVECEWQDTVAPSDIPIVCPDCNKEIVRANDPETPEDTKTDKI